MTDQDELYYAEAEEAAKYNEMSLQALALLAHKRKGNPRAMRIYSFCWQRNARHMAKAVDLFERDFRESGYSANHYLTLFAIAGVGKYERGMLYEDYRNKSLTYRDVLARVDELKKPKPRTKSPTLADKLRGFIEKLEADTTCSAGVELVCQRRMIADQLREMLG